MIVLKEQNNYLVKFPQKKNDKAMKYNGITTELKKGVWIAKTKVEAPLDCEITVRGDSEGNAIEKLVRLLTAD